MENIESLVKDLPDAEAARRFFDDLNKKSPSDTKKLLSDKALLSDVLTLSAFSPLLANDILRNPTYLNWLAKQKQSTTVREKDELLESLARFALTNTQVEPDVLLSRFRKRELIRIYLKDIRGLGTITEITEEISNLADAILEYALSNSIQELDNRYGVPLETDEKGKSKRAKFCVVALGKLGSKELNYSSDIDLLFLYSNDGSTSGKGSKGLATNREYFVKLAEFISKLVGGQTGEGAAYRVDLRLRPHGRVGALAVSLNEAKNYYRTSAQMWERQVLIRSRSTAGDSDLFQEFFNLIEPEVFSKELAIEAALENVRSSKEKIDLEKTPKNGFDVKLGKGGIREIEFIAQALQLAHGGSDEWLRSPHTLISLSRLADRKYIAENELTELFEAYDFLRRLEHRLQMEHGLQTHFLTDDLERRIVISQRMSILFVDDFNKELIKHVDNVSNIFARVFGEDYAKKYREGKHQTTETLTEKLTKTGDLKPLLSSIEKSDFSNDLNDETLFILKTFSHISPPFSEMLTANPFFINNLPSLEENFQFLNYNAIFANRVLSKSSYAEKIASLRREWANFILGIAFHDVFEKIEIETTRIEQTRLAEASISNAIAMTQKELEIRFKCDLSNFPFAVLGLGKLGGGTMDYGSDLDLLLVFDDEKPSPAKDKTHAEFYAKAVEIFVTTLSSLTRDGSLYRVDLRLRPDGKSGATSIGKNALAVYFNERSVVWEWLAYVKLRGIAGDTELLESAETTVRQTIHRKANDIDFEELRYETARMRNRLESEKSGSQMGNRIDIKFGEGGLQDIYFAIRFIQLAENIPDDPENRSTLNSLDKLLTNTALSREHYEIFSDGYEFLSELDHNLRLTVGRSTKLPIANKNALKIISKRMKLDSPNDLLEQLTSHRLHINAAFEAILESSAGTK